MQSLSSNSFQVIESSLLANQNPLQVLRIIQQSNPKGSVAFFKTAGLQSERFVPSLTLIGLKPLEVHQIKNENPFDIINKKIDSRKFKPHPDLPFFQGGAMGYFAYNSIRFLEPTLQKTSQERDAHEQYDAEFVFYEQFIAFDHEKEKVFLYSCADVDASKTEATQHAELKALESSIVNNLAINEQHLQHGFTQEIVPLEWSDQNSTLSKSEFLEAVEKLKFHILEGDIFQAVLSNRMKVPFQGDTVDLFQVLSELSPAPYQFYFSIDGRVFLGASPEMLIRSMGDVLETHPIAGTRPRGKDEKEEKQLEEELVSNEKEKAEHLMLVDLARNDIGRVSRPGTVEVSSFMKLRKFGGVMHLVSKVIGLRLASLSSISALASCFPAGTLSGAPKIRAMDLISEVEKSSRGFYGGAFVVASLNGDLDSCISIRSISIENGWARVQTGAGIVADSIPEMEFAEIEHKSSLTRKALAIVNRAKEIQA